MILLGSSAALLAGTVTAHSFNARRSNDWASQDRELDAVVHTARGDAYWRARSDNAAPARSIRHIDGLALGLLIGAGALATTGTVVWFTGDSDPRQRALGGAYSGTW